MTTNPGIPDENTKQQQNEITNWAEREVGAIDLGDKRRTRRLVFGLNAMLENIGKSIPEATGSWANCKAHYALLEREELTCELLLESHRTNSIQRAVNAEQEVILSLQDTSTLNFQTRTKLKGQGPIGASEKATGFHLHATSLVGADSGEFHGGYWGRNSTPGILTNAKMRPPEPATGSR